MKKTLTSGIATIGVVIALAIGGTAAHAANVKTELAVNSTQALSSVTNPPSQSHSWGGYNDSYSNRTCDSRWVKGSTKCQIKSRGYVWKGSNAGWEYK
ncbi:MAG: hypothetical protein FWH11_13760 [Micrococcales bacterium]|nr:hypothetical protein [Micrococcales bacterium]